MGVDRLPRKRLSTLAPPGGHQNSQKNRKHAWCSTNGPPGAQGGAKMTKHTPKASKMEPKSEVRHPLNRHPPGDPVKKGAICNPCIIYYVSSTSAVLEKVTCSLHWAPQNEGKIGSATEVAKKHHKTHAKGAEGEPQGRLWWPKGSPGSPK